MKIAVLILIPVISALIGWITNYIAVKMIFRPRNEICIFGIRIQGLIPKRKQDLAVKIAHTVEKELISHKDIREVLKSEDFHLQTSDVIRQKIEGFILTKASGNPLVAMFVTPEITSRLSTTIMDELQNEIPGVIDSILEKVETKIDFREIIQKKIEQFDSSKLESIVYNIASRELKAIEILGGVLGFLVGIIQLLLMMAGDIYG
ncbi:MAG TPA: DUF445 family protein [Chitinispirillaceae bacterium]|nr:DUF445 family protein [Chitinispirillaceae bacterium]